MIESEAVTSAIGGDAGKGMVRRPLRRAAARSQP